MLAWVELFTFTMKPVLPSVLFSRTSPGLIPAAEKSLLLSTRLVLLLPLVAVPLRYAGSVTVPWQSATSARSNRHRPSLAATVRVLDTVPMDCLTLLLRPVL